MAETTGKLPKEYRKILPAAVSSSVAVVFFSPEFLRTYFSVFAEN